MATLYITEYSSSALVQVSGNVMQVPQEPPLAEQTVSIGGTSTQSAAFNMQTTLVRVHTDAICSLLFGINPTASAASQRWAANQTEFRSVSRSQKYIVAVITNT